MEKQRNNNNKAKNFFYSRVFPDHTRIGKNQLIRQAKKTFPQSIHV